MTLWSFILAILDAVLPQKDTARLVRETSPELLGRLLAPRLIETTVPQTTALLPYRSSLVRALIIEAKFSENGRAHELLGELLADYLREYCAEHRAFETARRFVLIPLPLSAKRLRERGYNQVERIARCAAQGLQGLVTLDTEVLRRVRDTTPQTTLTRVERLANMDRAFVVQGTPDPETTYILLDDVTTTGATMSAALAACAAAEMQNVAPLTLAH